LADFICVAKLKSRHLISVPYSFVKVSYAMRKAYRFRLLLTRNQVEEANKAVDKVSEWKMVQRVLQSIFPQSEAISINESTAKN